MICHECGAHKTERATKGPLTVLLDPPQAYWKGKPFTITFREACALHLLCQRDKVGKLAMLLVAVGEDAFPKALDTLLSHLRKRLPPGVAIKTIWGWGYELIITETDQC